MERYPLRYLAVDLDGNLHSVAKVVQAELGLSERELRDGLNIGGGEYYKLLVDGRELYLIDNANSEVHMEKVLPAQFYLWFYPVSKTEIYLLENQVQQTLQAKGIKAWFVEE